MCGIAGIAGAGDTRARVATMLGVLNHRGPDGHGSFTDDRAQLTLGHTRLSIIDLSPAGAQPMTSADGRFVISFNGEVYNHVELRGELAAYPFRSRTDTEVVLAAWERWGPACLDRLNGMFAFLLWDVAERRLFAVRDRLGVKPLHYAKVPGGGMAFASEIKALHAAGVDRVPDLRAWATYLARGFSDHDERTFWNGVERVPPGSYLTWTPGGEVAVHRWYDLASRVADEDHRDERTMRDEYLALLRESIRLRFRSDVPVGINLSGGVDSSILLGLVNDEFGPDSDVKVFSFVTGDPKYDELPWITRMLTSSQHPLLVSTLVAADVPALAAATAAVVDEPYGGVPTLAYAKLFRLAREAGVIVLLDGQGIDEQWAGYDYYRTALTTPTVARLQGSTDPAVRADCVSPDLLRLDQPSVPVQSPDRLRNLQLQDLAHQKLPRAMRFNDRISMAASTELREPFLDYRLVELAVRQPADRKITPSMTKRVLRELAAQIVPGELSHAPKRAVQTPQREWLRGPLRGWATDRIEHALDVHRDWFIPDAARAAWNEFVDGRGDNSFWVWQWISASFA